MTPARRDRQMKNLPWFVGLVAAQMRKQAGITQAELGRRISWHRPIVTRFEHGRHLQQLRHLAEWANGCGQPLTRFTIAIDHYLGLLPPRRTTPTCTSVPKPLNSRSDGPSGS